MDATPEAVYPYFGARGRNPITCTPEVPKTIYIPPNLKPIAFSVQVKGLFKKMNFVPEDRRQAWVDAWSIRTMVSYALKRQRDSLRRGQIPRAPLLYSFSIDFVSSGSCKGSCIPKKPCGVNFGPMRLKFRQLENRTATSKQNSNQKDKTAAHELGFS